jgi:dTDP-glucose pyrophosphorylase
LIESLINSGKHVAAYPIHENWLDIGTHKNLKTARTTIKEIRSL